MRGRLAVEKRKLVGVCFAIIAVMITMAPYHADNVLWGNNLHSLWIGIIYTFSILAVLLAIPLFEIKKISSGIILAVVAVLIYVLLGVFHSYNSEYNGVFLMLQCISFLFLPNDVKEYAFKVFKRIWVVICVFGIVCFLSYILKIPIPYKEVPYYFSGDSLKYINYGIGFIYREGNILRLCGLCNEPGYFGTFCALILCSEEMNLKKRTNVIMFIAGMMTFSVAFFIIVVVYWILKAIVAISRCKNAKKRVLYGFCMIVVTVLYFVLFPNIRTGNVTIDNTIQRLTITSEGVYGDNRTTDDFDELYDSVVSTNLLFGMGRGYVRAKDVGNNSSYKAWIIEYGLIGCLLIWGLLIMAALHKNTKNKEIVLFVVVFFASIYQRPNIMTLPYMLLLMGGVEYIKYAIIKIDK